MEVGLHPRLNDTTLRVARLLASLNPCRPGIAYVMRRLRLSRRCVQNHLRYLREAGLLVYYLRGTRRRGLPPLASHYGRVIPPSFDAAHGIRTTGIGVHRRATGIADSGRKRIGDLACKAARPRPRRRRGTRRVSGTTCTPIQVRCSGSSTAAPTSLPPDANGAAGKTTVQRVGGGVRRRFQLAAELVATVGWLGNAPIPRVAWAVRDVADAGWSANAVTAWLQLHPVPEKVYRPSGLLISRLTGATAVWTTPAAREAGIIATREALTGRQRTADADRIGTGRAPSRAAALAIRQGLTEGRKRYSARQAERGLDDLDQRPQPPARELWSAHAEQRRAQAEIRAFLDQRPAPAPFPLGASR